MRIIILLVILLLISGTGCSTENTTNPVPEPIPTEVTEQDSSIKDDVLEVIKSIRSLEDIGDSMILEYDSLFNSTDLRMTPDKDSIKIEVGEFTGVKYIMSVSADSDCSFELNYDGDFADGQIICIKSDQTVERFYTSGGKESQLIELPKGDNYVGIVGYKAAGTFSLTIKENDNISIGFTNLL